MKKSTITIFLVLVFLKLQAQDYLISFAGTGGSTTVDSVQVKNLTQNTSLTLNGTDVLHLMGEVGIDQAFAQYNPGLRIYPNPMNERSFVEFEATSSGIAVIELRDITGKLTGRIQCTLSSGSHTFALSGIGSGAYTLSIRSTGYCYTGKLVCIGVGRGDGIISYLSGSVKASSQNSLKSSKSEVLMQYNDGNQLLFTCFSDIYSTVIPLVPTQSQTVTANFVACTDADNNNYATVTIGAQTWMAENLNVGVLINGTQEQTNNSIIEKYCYNDSVTNCNIYGGLYQWNEMMQYATTMGVKGICPSGWHIPTDAEWTTVTTFLGGEIVAGGKMKSTGTIEAGTGLWYDPNTGATNESGFTAVPAGALENNCPFFGIGHYGDYWSSSNYNTNDAWYWFLYYSYSGVFRYYNDKNDGVSVRCLWDVSIPFTCGSPITVNHVTGVVAPIDKTVTYGTVNNIPGEPSKCWITRNLGSDNQATEVDDATEPSAGWYWQFNRMQGFKHDGTTRTPITVWINPISENSDWIPANDPCTIELGSDWRIPTQTEWTNVDASGNWANWNGPWGSGLKLHAAGYLFYTDGSLSHRGSYAAYWSGTQAGSDYGWNLYFESGLCFVTNTYKSAGFNLRCVKE